MIQSSGDESDGCTSFFIYTLKRGDRLVGEFGPGGGCMERRKGKEGYYGLDHFELGHCLILTLLSFSFSSLVQFLFCLHCLFPSLPLSEQIIYPCVLFPSPS